MHQTANKRQVISDDSLHLQFERSWSLALEPVACNLWSAAAFNKSYILINSRNNKEDSRVSIFKQNKWKVQLTEALLTNILIEIGNPEGITTASKQAEYFWGTTPYVAGACYGW